MENDHDEPEIFGEYPPITEIQEQMWLQMRQHLTHDQSMEYMHSYFPLYEHEDDEVRQ